MSPDRLPDNTQDGLLAGVINLHDDEQHVRLALTPRNVLRRIVIDLPKTSCVLRPGFETPG